MEILKLTKLFTGVRLWSPLQARQSSCTNLKPNSFKLTLILFSIYHYYF